MEATTTIKLTDGMEIRVNHSDREYLQPIHVFTHTATAAKYGLPSELREMDASKGFEGDEAVYCLQDAACLTANYAGKAEAMATERATTDAAPIISDGQVVEVEGRTFTTVYHYQLAGISNPVRFVPTHNPQTKAEASMMAWYARRSAK